MLRYTHCIALQLVGDSLVVDEVVLHDPFRGMRAWRNSTETQQSGHAPRSGPEVKNGRSSAKDGAPERLRYGTIQKVVSQLGATGLPDSSEKLPRHF